MLRKNIGPVSTPQPQPLTITTYPNGQPVRKVITAPVSRLSTKGTQQAITVEKLKQQTNQLIGLTAGRLRAYGVDGHPERKWNSLSVNQNYVHDYAAGIFGNAREREKAYWDRDAFEDSKATLEGWKPKPWKGQTRIDENGQEQRWVETCTTDGHWERVEASCGVNETAPTLALSATASGAHAVSAEMQKAAINKRMTKHGINLAYEAYALNPHTELGNLEAALYAFSSKDGRRNECRSLLDAVSVPFDAEDILSDFTVNLIHRFKRGEYHTHVGKFHNWIGYVWSNWFFPTVQTKAYTYSNLTQDVCDDELKNGEEGEDREEGEAGTFYRATLELEMVKRNEAKPYDPSRLVTRILMDLDKPETYFGSLALPVRTMIRKLADGCTKAQAAKAAGVSDRQAYRLFQDLQETTKGSASNLLLFEDAPKPCVLESLQAAAAPAYGRPKQPENRLAEIVEAHEKALTVPQLAVILQVSKREVYRLVQDNRLPALRIGTLIRLDPGATAEWIRGHMTMAA